MKVWQQDHPTEAVAMFDAPTVPFREHLRACGDYGPYWRRNKDGHPLSQRRCTRPTGHEGNHQYSTKKDGPRNEWGQDGRMVWP